MALIVRAVQRGPWSLLVAGLILVWSRTATADELVLKNGLRLTGRHAPIKEVGGNALAVRANAGQVDVQLVRLIDDGLRRTFVSHYQIDKVTPQIEPLHGIEIPHQRVARSGREVSSVGRITGVQPFDQWGRRTIWLSTPRGAIDVIQGITEITPVFAKVEALVADRSVVWDMRIATSSIPQAVLSSVLMHALDPNSPNDRLSIVRLYIQSQRYEDALAELNTAIADFPELANLRDQEKELRQLSARRLVQEIKLRLGAGQHHLAGALVTGFPATDVAQEILLELGELAQEYEKANEQIERARGVIDQLMSELPEEVRGGLAPIHKEILRELNRNNLNRMADLLRLADDKQLAAEQKLSMAISGWLLGAGSAVENLAVSRSLVEVRDLVREYLRTGADQSERRAAIVERLAGLEGSSPAHVAKLLRFMKPPGDLPESSEAGKTDGTYQADVELAGLEDSPAPPESIPGLYTLNTPGLPEDGDIEYLVQLPPEYDPYRVYPAIVTLHGAEASAELQIDWWAGTYNPQMGMRMGQAGRHGYMVIAPRWSGPQGRPYGYSAREHAAVLFSFRDACQRFSIDTDRVFLSGHSGGGDAAWDIGLAHPDLWAGVIPIGAVAVRDEATAPQYISHYGDNAKHVPLYFVHGERDGNKVLLNSRQYNRYLQRTGYDTIVVEYIGRGHEHFQEEIHRLIEWMGLHQRDFFPAEFTCASMRPWDSFFWWAELEGLPSRSMVLPLAWPSPKSRAVQIIGEVRPNNSISLRSGAGRTTVWLAPEMADFNQRLTLNVDGQTQRLLVTPSTEVLLEDARTRGDRLHPFWAKVQVQGRRR